MRDCDKLKIIKWIIRLPVLCLISPIMIIVSIVEIINWAVDDINLKNTMSFGYWSKYKL